MSPEFPESYLSTHLILNVSEVNPSEGGFCAISVRLPWKTAWGMATIDLTRHRTPRRERTREKLPSPMIARFDLLQQPLGPH